MAYSVAADSSDVTTHDSHKLSRDGRNLALSIYLFDKASSNRDRSNPFTNIISVYNI